MFHDIMSVCIIMHNMIVEDECETNESIVDLNVMFVPEVDMIVDKTEHFNGYLFAINKLKLKKTHYTLRNALIEHFWEIYSNNVSCS